MRLTIIILSLMFFMACKNDKKITQAAPEVSADLPASFMDFYERFHKDSVFQMQHIVFPLSEREDKAKWTRNEWQMHKGFDNFNGGFERDFVNFNGIITETIREKNNTFIIQRRFAPSGESYNLIYYKIINHLEQWGEKVLSDTTVLKKIVE